MSEPNTDVSLAIINNLPAILTAAVPIVTSVVGLIVAFLARKDAKNAQTGVAQSKAAINGVIDTTEALVVRASIPASNARLKSVGASVELSPEVVQIPALPEKFDV